MPLNPPLFPDFSYEQALHKQGFIHVAGIDEAGRGPLAGPVVAAACILPDGLERGLNDSKKLSAKRREALYDDLSNDSRVIWSVASVSADEIDRINILQATHQAMARAAQGLRVCPDYCLIDGRPVPSFPFDCQSIIKGDGKSLSIAAASIFAKVTRDRCMESFALEYPEYGFEKHKGYGTRAHLEALKRYGVTPLHRRSFSPVAQLL